MTPLRAARPLVGLAALALALVACTGGASTAPSTMPSMATQSQTPDPGVSCETAPDPGPLAGWTAPATSPTILPVIVNSQIACGEERVLFSFLDASNRPMAVPERTATMAIYDLAADASTPISTVDGTFVWGIEGSRGLYHASVDFPRAGIYGAEFTTTLGDAPAEQVRMTFSVSATSYGLRPGDQAPMSETPTADAVGGDLARLSTDADPDPRFYEVSVAAALEAREPFVLVFATPKFCTSAQCGPTLDVVKPFADDHPGVRFINVEPYKLVYQDGSLRADLDANNQLQPVPAVDEWRLLTEPVIFVVGRDGIIAAVFEGVIGADELAAAIALVE